MIFFNNNLNNLKKTWERINGLLSRKEKTYMTINNLKQPHTNTTTNLKSRIPNILNEHFASIGPRLVSKLPLLRNNLRNTWTKTSRPLLYFILRQ